VVYRRGKVYWYRIKITRAEPDGTSREYLIRRPAHTRRQREAQNIEDEHRRALRLGQVHPLDPWPPAAPPQAPTLKDFSERFLKHIRLHAKASTATFYNTCLKRTLPFHPLSEIPMSTVTTELVAKYVRFRQSLPGGNSVAALNAEMRTLRRCFRLAEEWALIRKAPVIHELPGKVSRERVVSFEEERMYLSAAPSTLRDITILAVDTGLRPNSELFTLEWANVHSEPSAEGQHGHIHVPGGKTDAARRNVPLTPRAKAVLQMRRSERTTTSRFVFPGPGMSGHIVTVQHSHERAIERVNKEAREAGLEKPAIEPFEFYCWRHTCGTRWAEAGMDKYTVARLMGHSSPRVAERYYIHVTEPHVTSGFERFVSYLERRIVDAVPEASERVQ
jgi:integrase